MQEWRDASNVVQAFLDKSFVLSTQGLKIAGTALSSVHLSDSAQLARLASPAFTGTPTSPTPTAGDNTTKIATTAFVAASFAPLNSPALSGTPTAPTPTAGDNSTKIATTAFVATSFAPLVSPALTGTPTAPTPANGDNSSKIATTAYVASNGAPTGGLIQYAGTTAPSGWLLCDGSAISRTTYASLFAVIGTAYGTGDGSTTFNLPDLRGRVPVGYSSGGKTEVATLGHNEGLAANLRNISHHHKSVDVEGGSGWAGTNSSGNQQQYQTNTTGDTDNTDKPAYLVVNYIIKT